MVDASAAVGDRIEEREDMGTGDAGLYAYWMAQEAIAEKEERNWVKQSRKIIKRYRDERPEQPTQGIHRFNILWSNVETLKPTLYARTPKADVQRRFKDQDPVARMSSTLLERCLEYSIDAFDFDGMMRAAVEDRLLPGRGVARVLYVPHFGEPPQAKQAQQIVGYTPQAQNPNEKCALCKHFQADTQSCALVEDPIYPDGWCRLFDAKQATGPDADLLPGEDNEEFEAEEDADVDVNNPGDEGKSEPDRVVTYEEVIGRYVFWEDYREGPARQWHEVPWIRYQAYMNRDELVERFGNKGKLVNLDYTPKGLIEAVKNEPPPDLHKKARVFEVWDKIKKMVVWYAPGTPNLILDEIPDPLRLPDFFPNPDPLLATTTNDRRVPVPDYVEYQDQAAELDSLTARIDKLTKALKVSGVYPGDEKQVLQQLIDEGTENRLIPVGDWTAWADKGGLKTFIEWMPIQQVAQTLIQLHEARDKAKAVLYEITGIGDIIRGNTIPEETATAQTLKASFATRRIEPKQKEVARFARDMLRLMGAVIAEHFSAETISMITGYPQLQPVPQLPPPPQMPKPMAQAELADPTQPPQPGEARVANGAISVTPTPQAQQYQQAMAQYQQMQQQVQAIQQKNAQLQKQFDDAVALIKKDGVHSFRIDIEADSTVAMDEQQEKADRVEFLQQFVPLLENVMPIAQGNPAVATLAKEITLFAARGFRVARPLEESIEQAFDAIAQMPPQQQGNGGPDSAADLAVRKQEIDTRAKIANDKNRIDEQKLALQASEQGQKHVLETAELANKQIMDKEKLLDNRAARQDQEAFRHLRETKLESGLAKNLS